MAFTQHSPATPAALRIIAIALCALVPVFLWTAGCNRAARLALHPVSGTVTLDGEPVAEGFIEFRALSGDTRGFAGPVKNGAYAAKTFAAPMTVSITAFREVPGKFMQAAPDMPKQPATEQYIPARYNAATELKADIPAGGNRRLDFELKSK
jgi:hypothetical protein